MTKPIALPRYLLIEDRERIRKQAAEAAESIEANAFRGRLLGALVRVTDRLALAHDERAAILLGAVRDIPVERRAKLLALTDAEFMGFVKELVEAWRKSRDKPCAGCVAAAEFRAHE